MRNDSFTIKFYLNIAKRRDNGAIPIYVRIMVNRKKAELSTKQFVAKIDDWNEEIQRINLKSPINSSLSVIEGQLIDLYNEMKASKVVITAASIKNRYLGRGQSTITLLDYYSKALDETISTNMGLAEATIKNYKTTFKHLKEFLIHEKLKNITIQEFDIHLIKKYDQFLQNKNLVNSITKKLSQSSVAKYHVKLRALLNMAVDDGEILRNPYLKFKIKKSESLRTFLTKDELRKIEEHSLGGNKSLDCARDKFLFSVYTGMRFSDADNLKDQDVEFDGKKYWLTFRQQKTKGIQRIPLLGRAKVIYEKYEFERLITGYVLPRLSNQKVNAYLKTIAELAGINKVLTHHVARHTNATTIYLANGVPLEIVKKQLGHTSIKTTEIYAKITNDMLSKAADTLDKILK
jgi:integrase/recombinase XerD